MLGGADNPNGELPSYITGADSRCAAESRRGEVASILILPETEQKTAIHTLYQSMSSCLIVVSAHMVHKGC